MSNNNNNVADKSIKKNQKMRIKLEKEMKGLFEARDNERNPNDKQPIIYQIEVAQALLKGPFGIEPYGAN